MYSVIKIIYLYKATLVSFTTNFQKKKTNAFISIYLFESIYIHLNIYVYVYYITSIKQYIIAIKYTIFLS